MDKPEKINEPERVENGEDDRKIITLAREEISELTFAEAGTFMVTSRCPDERGLILVKFAVITETGMMADLSDLERRCAEPYCTRCWLKEV